MNALVGIKGGAAERVPAGLNDRLVWLTKFGKPKVGVYGSGGWHAHIEMHVADTVKGASFEVKSEFKHQTPDEAVGVLIERMLDTLAQIGAAA